MEKTKISMEYNHLLMDNSHIQMDKTHVFSHKQKKPLGFQESAGVSIDD